ncbi:MAG: lipid-A-disaccharide synthase, partial [Pseudomonadota bacterium]
DIPEFLFERCTADALTDAMAELLKSPEVRHRQLAACSEALDMLGKGGEAPGLRAARSVLSHL